MSTVTTYLNLVKAALLEQFSLATLNNNLDLIDANAVTQNKAAKGVVANNDNPASSTGLGGSGIMCDLVQANLVSGRWYEVSYRVATITTIADMTIILSMKKSATSDSTAAGTDVTSDTYAIYTAPVVNSYKAHLATFLFKATATETVNLKAVMARATGSVTYDISGRHLSVTDKGAQI